MPTFETKEAYAREMDRRRSEGLILCGDTWPIREELKKAGSHWDHIEKYWLVPSEELCTKHGAVKEDGKWVIPKRKREPSTKGEDNE